MKHFVAIAGLIACSLPLHAQTAPVGLRGQIDACRITSGPYARGYKLNKAAAGMNFYFAAQGLRGVTGESAYFAEVKGFLNLYLEKADPTHGWIDDVSNVATGGIQVSDSDDSYCAGMLVLARDYYLASHDRGWWQNHDDLLKGIAQKILLNNQLSSGLVTAYSQERDFSKSPQYNLDANEIANKQALRHQCYLMDNCEVYAGLKALGQILTAEDDTDADKFLMAAQEVAEGISSLYNPTAKAFYILDADQNAFPNFYPDQTIKFYPHRVAQMFPELYKVPLLNATRTSRLYEEGWTFVNAKQDNWYNGFPADGSTGGFPWTLIGYAAAMRGKTGRANQQYNWYKSDWEHKKVAPSSTGDPLTNFIYIQEVGNALRLQKKLDSAP